jgi:hypothetical protein
MLVFIAVFKKHFILCQGKPYDLESGEGGCPLTHLTIVRELENLM